MQGPSVPRARERGDTKGKAKENLEEEENFTGGGKGSYEALIEAEQKFLSLISQPALAFFEPFTGSQNFQIDAEIFCRAEILQQRKGPSQFLRDRHLLAPCVLNNLTGKWTGLERKESLGCLLKESRHRDYLCSGPRRAEDASCCLGS